MTKVALSELHKNILNDTLSQLKQILAAESVSLFLVDKDQHELILNSVFDEHKAQFKGLRQRIGEGVAGSVATKGEAILVKDIKTDPRFLKERFRHYHTNSFICVPIVTREGLIGIINISDKQTGEPFSESDFGVACLFAQMASHIVDNEISIISLKEENEILRQEKAQIKQERAFLEKFASVGKLAGGIVHEINNPLDAVMRYTNLLIERDMDPSVAKEYLNEIKVGLTRIVKITRSLLEFSQQLNDNRYQEYGNVNDIIEEALSLFRHTVFLGHIKIEKNYSDLLPKVVDKGLCRVFSNLIKNAFDSMPNGGTLRIMTKQVDGHIAVSFKDSGCGIADDVRDKIFTPFFTTKPIGHGIGLGLPICFEVIQRYEGKIDVETQVGEGTEFKVYLPLKYTPVGK
ncbi:MAG: GAF domain-containing protein [Candidatus Omnitrophica bacterium]|nr:GAF domain-containing protein [Candidatus Omnitrophota bacterium]